MYFIRKEINNLNSYVFDGESYLNLDTLEIITNEEYNIMLSKVFNHKDEAIKQFCLSIIQEKGKILIIENEIQRLQELKNIRKIKVESITNIIRDNCDTNIDFDIFKLSFRKGVDSVVIDDESLIPQIFKEKIETYKIDKISIKNMLKSEEEVKGAYLSKGKKSVIIK